MVRWPSKLVWTHALAQPSIWSMAFLSPHNWRRPCGQWGNCWLRAYKLDTCRTLVLWFVFLKKKYFGKSFQACTFLNVHSNFYITAGAASSLYLWCRVLLKSHWVLLPCPFLVMWHKRPLALTVCWFSCAVHSQLPNLWWIPNSLSRGFGTAIRIGSSRTRWFQWSPTIYISVSSQVVSSTFRLWVS